MSDQSMTRRDAVKLGGTALASVGLSAGASGASAQAAPTPATGYPDFRGKTVAFHIRAKRDNHQLVSDPMFVVQAGRLFVTGAVPTLDHWTDGLPVAFAWDLVQSYYVYESVEDFRSRCEKYKSAKERKAEAGAPADRPRS